MAERESPPRVDWRGADLRHVNLAGVSLAGADLRACDLRGVNLAGGDLRGRRPAGARVQGANFQNACLYGAKMQGIEAFGANFRGADLRLANLGGAYLEGATLPPPAREAPPTPGEIATDEAPAVAGPQRSREGQRGRSGAQRGHGHRALRRHRGEELILDRPVRGPGGVPGVADDPRGTLPLHDLGPPVWRRPLPDRPITHAGTPGRGPASPRSGRCSTPRRKSLPGPAARSRRRWRRSMPRSPPSGRPAPGCSAGSGRSSGRSGPTTTGTAAGRGTKRERSIRRRPVQARIAVRRPGRRIRRLRLGK